MVRPLRARGEAGMGKNDRTAEALMPRATWWIWLAVALMQASSALAQTPVRPGAAVAFEIDPGRMSSGTSTVPRPIDNVAYQWLGELYAKAYRHVILEGKHWEPVRPTFVRRTGATINVDFHVPVRPLILDTDRVSNPGNYGFEYTDNATPPAISAVEVTGPSTVRITLASTPAGGNQRLRYAWTGTPTNNAGPTTGPRGCLRDNDRTPSLHGHELWNWCVHFDIPVTT